MAIKKWKTWTWLLWSRMIVITSNKCLSNCTACLRYKAFNHKWLKMKKSKTISNMFSFIIHNNVIYQQNNNKLYKKF